MDFDDDEVVGRDVVRSYVATGGRTRSHRIDLAFETRVELNPDAEPPTALQFERLHIARYVQQHIVISIAEISAALRLPPLTTQVLVSDLVADTVLLAHDTVGSEIDLDALSDIRAAISSL